MRHCLSPAPPSPLQPELSQPAKKNLWFPAFFSLKEKTCVPANQVSPILGLCSLSGTSPFRGCSYRILSTFWGFGCHSCGSFVSDRTLHLGLLFETSVFRDQLCLESSPPLPGIHFATFHPSGVGPTSGTYCREVHSGTPSL